MNQSTASQDQQLTLIKYPAQGDHLNRSPVTMTHTSQHGFSHGIIFHWTVADCPNSTALSECVTDLRG